MTTTEINRALHEALGKCWHDTTREAMGVPVGLCSKCGRFNPTYTPDYCADPRLVIEAMREREDFIRFLKTTGSGGDMLILTGKTLPVDNVEHREFVYLDLIMDKTGKLAMLAIEWMKGPR